MALIILSVVLLVMVAIDSIPGDPVAMMLGQGATGEAVAKLRTALHLDLPLPVRYVRYLWALVHGDLGRSIVDGRPVRADISYAWVATLQLGTAALVISVVVGGITGVLSARWRASVFDDLVRVVSLVGLSMPSFWTGLLLILVFSWWLGWLPSGGRGSWPHLVLPAVTLSLYTLATLTRVTRATMLEVLREDYVRMARAKGVTEVRVLFHHALRNALIPVVTVLGVQMGQLLGGAILVETVFAWPGLGRTLVQAIFTRDYTLLEGGVLVLALTFVVANLLVDLAYVRLDPRIVYR